MKCQHCEKPATFHITELIEPSGPHVLHLCEDHARQYLSQDPAQPGTSALAGVLASQLKLDQSAEQIASLDQKTCPVCGITFAEFRNIGRLGCPYDYVHFQADLEPLLINIHGATTHHGKHPSKMSGSPDRQHRLLQLRREMKEAVEKEQYERATEIRDEIRRLEQNDAGE
jgi:protein arginine kinase activator